MSESGKKICPHMKRLLWNWDHSTNWCLNTIGRQNCGVANPYTKKPDEFVHDFTRMIDFCSVNRIDAVGVVGLLRDCHGGWETARRICDYGRKRGVRVYLIAGLYSYGGLYYEGDSPLSLVKFLSENPDCMAQTLDHRPKYLQYSWPHGVKRDPSACPSHPLVREFVLESLSKLFAELPELGGIQMEAGDSGVCCCERCLARRSQGGDADSNSALSLSDMADIYPEAARAVRNASEDAWIICENYVHFLNNPAYGDPGSPAIRKLLSMPDDIFWQWSDRRLKPGMWTESDRLPEHLRRFRHIMRCHHGTQWDGGRHTLVIDKIREQCRLSQLSGMNAVSIFGECSPFHANTEFNYLALSYFGDDPQASLDSFMEDVMEPRLGGSVQLAARYVEMAALTTDPAKIPAAVMEIAGIMSRLSGNYDAVRRWTYLASFLNAYYFEFTQQNRVASGERINLDVLQKDKIDFSIHKNNSRIQSVESGRKGTPESRRNENNDEYQ